MIGFVQDPPFEAEAALYFMAGGHYLFRRADKGNYQSKFVTVRDVAAAFSQQEIDSGWLPAGVVRCGHSAKGPWFVYSAPAQKVTIYMTPPKGFSSAPIDLTIPIPRTVLMGIGSDYCLWAMKSTHFELDEDAYHAPFPNVFSEAEKICWGTNRPGEAEAGKARKVWELFFQTTFNADLASQKSVTHPEDVRLLLLELGGKNKFPTSELLTTRWNIRQAVERMLT